MSKPIELSQSSRRSQTREALSVAGSACFVVAVGWGLWQVGQIETPEMPWWEPEVKQVELCLAGGGPCFEVAAEEPGCFEIKGQGQVCLPLPEGRSANAQ